MCALIDSLNITFLRLFKRLWRYLITHKLVLVMRGHVFGRQQFISYLLCFKLVSYDQA